MAKSRGSWLTCAMALFLGWSVMACLIRVSAKYKTRTWGRDDSALSFAFLTSVVHVALVGVALQHGFGQPMEELSASDQKQMNIALYTSDLFYVLSMSLCRASAAYFVAQLTFFKSKLRPAHFLVGLSAIWAVASTCILAFRGSLREPWMTMNGTDSLYKRWVGIEGSGYALDLIIWGLTAHVIWRLHMKLSKRVFILSVLAFRLLLAPIIACRLIQLQPDKNTNPTVTNIVPAIITEAALQFSIIAGTITALKPFLTSFDPAAMPESTTKNSSSAQRSHEPYYNLEAIKSSGALTAKHATGVHEITWQPYDGGKGRGYAEASRTHDSSNTAKLSSRSTTSASWADKTKGMWWNRLSPEDVASSTATDSQDRMIIELTTEVTVRVDESGRQNKATLDGQQ